MRARLLAHPGLDDLQLLPDPGDQLVIRRRERCDPGDEEVLGHLLHADPRRLQPRDHVSRTVEVVTHRVAPHGAVVAEGLDGRRRHGIDGVRANQRLGVEHVPVLGVLGARAGPQRPLQRGAGLAQRGELLAAEMPLEGRVGEAGVGDRRLAEQAPELRGVAARREPLIEQGVHRGVHPAHEEGGHRVDVQRLARGVAPLQAADVGGDHLLVGGEGKDQGHVDIDPGGDQLLDRGDALGGRRDLHHEVWPVDPVPVLLGGPDASGGVVREGRGQLQADVAVGAPGALVHRAQGVRRVLDVADGEPQEDLIGVVDPVAEQLVDLLVVVGAVSDRLLEDGRVTGQSGDVVLGDQPGQLGADDQLPADVVEPHRLAALGQEQERVEGGHRCHWPPALVVAAWRAALTIPSASIPSAASRSAVLPLPGTSRTARWSIRGGWSPASASMTAAPRPPSG